MYRKVLIGGVTAAAIVGAGGAALALSGPDAGTHATLSAASTSATPAGHGKHHGRFGALRRLEHGTLVTKGKDGTVTHQLIRGVVTAVSSDAITVQAADHTTESFVVTKDTKVRVRPASGGKGEPATIAKVAKGDTVFVAGTGTSTVTAKRILDLGTK